MKRRYFLKTGLLASLLTAIGVRSAPAETVSLPHPHACRMPPRPHQKDWPWAPQDHCDATLVCYGRTEDECRHNRTRYEVGCLMEQKLAAFGVDGTQINNHYNELVRDYEARVSHT